MSNETPPADGACANTDTELWSRETSKDSEPFHSYASISETREGAITICVGGFCVTRPIEDWHALAAQPAPDGLAEELARLDANATPAPFYTLDQPWLTHGETSILSESPDPHVARYICDFDLGMFVDEDDKTSECPQADADLLVWLRNHVPEILTALRANQRNEVIEECAKVQIAEVRINPSHDYEMGWINAARTMRKAIRALATKEPGGGSGRP